jgi:hypothetical protein
MAFFAGRPRAGGPEQNQREARLCLRAEWAACTTPNERPTLTANRVSGWRTLPGAARWRMVAASAGGVLLRGRPTSGGVWRTAPPNAPHAGVGAPEPPEGSTVCPGGWRGATRQRVGCAGTVSELNVGRWRRTTQERGYKRAGPVAGRVTPRSAVAATEERVRGGAGAASEKKNSTLLGPALRARTCASVRLSVMYDEGPHAAFACRVRVAFHKGCVWKSNNVEAHSM